MKGGSPELKVGVSEGKPRKSEFHAHLLFLASTREYQIFQAHAGDVSTLSSS